MARVPGFFDQTMFWKGLGNISVWEALLDLFPSGRKTKMKILYGIRSLKKEY